MKRLLLGVDLGTSCLKAGLFDRQGHRQGFGSVPCPVLSNSNGQAEHDPEQWWQACCVAVRAALAQAEASPSAIAAVGISGFHHCPVFVRRDGRPARPTILTHDDRLHETWDELSRSGLVERLANLTGSMISPGHFPPIYHFVRKHDAESLARTAHLMLPKDYLRLRLTGEPGTDLCDATGTNLVRMPERGWSSQLCSISGVDSRLLPPIAGSHELCGVVRREVAQEAGLAAKTPVCCGGGDTHCAMLGLGVIAAGQAALLLGTNAALRGCFESLPRHPQNRVWIQQHVVPERFTASASTMAGSSVLDWFCRTFCSDLMGGSNGDVYAELEEMVAGVPRGSDGLLFNPYIAGERSPFVNPRACGTFTGIRTRHTRRHFLRSVMEGVACCIANCFDLLSEVSAPSGRPIETIRMAGGGSRLGVWCRIIADVLGRPITLMRRSDAGCLGAAMLAGIAVGMYPGFDEAVRACVPEGTLFQPDSEAHAFYSGLRERFNRLTHCVEAEFFK